MPLFSKSHKNPAEIVKVLKENMAILEKQEKKTDKASEEVSKSLQAMKEILCGTTDKEPPTEIVAQLAQELYNSGLLVTLIANLQLIDFEAEESCCSRLSAGMVPSGCCCELHDFCGPWALGIPHKCPTTIGKSPEPRSQTSNTESETGAAPNAQAAAGEKNQLLKEI